MKYDIATNFALNFWKNKLKNTDVTVFIQKISCFPGNVNHSQAASYLRLNNTETKRKNRNEPVGIKKVQRNETVSDVIILSDDESDGKVDIMSVGF